MGVSAALGSLLERAEPGGSAAFEVRLGNDGPVDEVVRLRVVGAAAPFSWVAPEQVTIPAEGEATAKVGFHLPKSATLAAGPLRFRVEATAPASGATAAAEGTLEVTAFAVLSATLDPTELSGGDGGRCQLSVTTRGNAPVEVALAVWAGEAMEASVDPPTVTVEPNRVATATVDVVPSVGGKRAEAGRHKFTVTATPAVGSPLEVAGSYVVEAANGINRRLVTSGAIAVVALAALVLGVVAFTGGSSDPTTAASSGDEILASCPGEVHRDIFGIAGLNPDDIAKLPGQFSFLRLKADNCFPQRFNPCEPIHFIQNVAAAYPGAAADGREAFLQLSEATGITFIDDGLTDETGRTGPYIPDRYPGRWAPILILWERFGPERTEGPIQIYGNAIPYRVNEIIVSGRLRFNVDAYNDEFARTPVEGGFGPPADSGTGPVGRRNVTWGRVVLHELGHLIGLGHTSSTDSLMYPDAADHTTRPTKFAAGDLLGLKYLGREAGCLPAPPFPAS
ncbi:MAG: matrixin family metalloprotease [Acidimicrobiales bacterium]